MGVKTRNKYLALARKELASAGGVARAKALSEEERVKIAKMGGRAGGRGRRKEDLIPDEIREKIWKLLEENTARALWWVSDEGRRPRTRSMAKRSLRSVASYGSLQSYKEAHELIKCL